MTISQKSFGDEPTLPGQALGAALLTVYGAWQVEGKARHLIASKLVDRAELLGALPTASREFC
ncbi:hypothetical protein [Burkholderia lata]|uniref:hypothetical protein n=1 Tax=Burkholderia lata (strain ATCC 17760 / DSM 23089 / LMG 22485 / NCIMB 9086 / R18194 / 383) TaxID=482957 RepID=UPI001583D477|nr:hypothetical protein [Burkholderia lata]